MQQFRLDAVQTECLLPTEFAKSASKFASKLDIRWIYPVAALGGMGLGWSLFVIEGHEADERQVDLLMASKHAMPEQAARWEDRVWERLDRVGPDRQVPLPVLWMVLSSIDIVDSGREDRSSSIYAIGYRFNESNSDADIEVSFVENTTDIRREDLVRHLKFLLYSCLGARA